MAFGNSAATSRSLKPTTATSSAASRPQSHMAPMTPIAAKSLAAKMEVGGRGNDNNYSPLHGPERTTNPDGMMKSSETGYPAASEASLPRGEPGLDQSANVYRSDNQFSRLTRAAASASPARTCRMISACWATEA